MKSILAAVLVLSLTACANAGPIANTNASTATPAATPAPAAAVVSTPTLVDKVNADLTQAIVDAKASNDLMAPQRAKCYTTLQGLLPQLPVVSAQSHASAGIVDTFELGAERVEDIATLADYQMPPAVKLAIVVDCGPLKARAEDLLLLFNLKLVSVAGQAAILAK